MPIIRSLSTAVAASGLPLELGGSSAVGRVRAGQPAVDFNLLKPSGFFTYHQV